MPSSPVNSELIGREFEIQLLREVLAAESRTAPCLELSGEAGVGKSVLLDAAQVIAEDAGFRVLSVRGIQAESQFPFAGLHRLLGPIMATDEVLPAAQRAALHTALGRGDGPAPSLFLTGLATLTLLTEEAANRPVVVLVDDMQWLDEASQTVLAFVARRLSDDPVTVVATIRTGQPHHFAEVPARVHRVQPVEERAARRILASVGEPLSEADQVRILDLARGNPLALVELARSWRSGGPALADATTGAGMLVRTSERLQRSFAGRAQELPATTRDLLLVAALTDSEDLDEILAATTDLTGQHVTADAADAAVAAGLIFYDAAHLRFRHPLVRSAIVAAESPGRQQRASRSLARVLDAQPDRQVRFLAAASSAPDEAVAASLVRQADTSLDRGAVLDAVASLERAARLSPDPQTRGRRMLVAAEHAFGLGRSDLVRQLVGEASAAPLSELDRARLAWLTEIFDDGDPGDIARVRELCAAATRSSPAVTRIWR